MATLALDIGSTRIKAARFASDGRTLMELVQREAPAILKHGTGREFDPQELLERALSALEELDPKPGESLGIASQRSSFLLWNARDGAPVTPVISWQDRRGTEWIAQHAAAEPWVSELTGLPLSAHYVGPKLGAMLAADRALARRAKSGELLFGTLETWLAWKAYAGRLHVTDETMAARTLLFDPRRGEWSARLCELFGVPPALLPRVQPTSGRADAFGTLVLRASIADQSAGALYAAGTGARDVLVNFGTGTFVLAPNGVTWVRRPGYPTSLLVSRSSKSGERLRSYACEGTVNAGASLIAAGATAEPADDDLPADAFALVDENGIGAPHWRAELGPLWSPAATRLDGAAKLRVAEQGLCFRVREILEDLDLGSRFCVVAGGALYDEAFAQRLADALGRVIGVCLEPEATLAGAAGLARGRWGFASGHAKTRAVEPSKHSARLAARFEAWRRWTASALRR